MNRGHSPSQTDTISGVSPPATMTSEPLFGRETVPSRAAFGTDEIVRQVFERSAGIDPGHGIANRRIVDPAADVADVFLHRHFLPFGIRWVKTRPLPRLEDALAGRDSPLPRLRRRRLAERPAQALENGFERMVRILAGQQRHVQGEAGVGA